MEKGLFIKMPDELKLKFRLACAKNGKYMNAVFVELAEDYVSQNKENVAEEIKQEDVMKEKEIEQTDETNIGDLNG